MHLVSAAKATAFSVLTCLTLTLPTQAEPEKQQISNPCVPTLIQDLYTRALEEVRTHKYFEALRDLTDVTEAQPNFAPAYAAKGNLFMRHFLGNEAAEQFSKAIKLDPRNSAYYAERGRAYLFPDKFEEADRDFDRALSLDSKCARAIAGKGIALIDHKKYLEGIAVLRQAADLSPHDGMMHIKMAYAYQKLKRFDEALKEANTAIALSPDDPNMQYSRAFIYKDMKDYGKMVQDFDSAIKGEPSFETYHFYFAKALVDIDDTKRALEQIQAALVLAPENARYLAWKANIEVNAGLLKEAITDATKAIAIDNNYSSAYQELAWAHFVMGQNNLALVQAEKAVSLSPKDTNALNLRSRMLESLGRYKEAIASCDETLKIDEHNARALNYRAFCHQRLGNTKQALEDCDSAIAYGKDDPESWIYSLRAGTLTLMGKYDAAERDETIANKLRYAKVNTTDSTVQTPLTEQQSWALACSAILFVKNHNDCNSLAGSPITGASRAKQKFDLNQDWHIYNKQDLRRRVENLVSDSEHYSFSRMGEMVTALSKEEFATYEGSLDRQPELLNRARIARQYYRQLGAKGISGWDLSRAINVCRFAYLAGFVDEKEAWALIAPVARKIQATFSNFEELGQNYLIGRKFWNQTETHNAGSDFDIALLELKHFKSSPYKKQPWNLQLTDSGFGLNKEPEQNKELVTETNYKKVGEESVEDLIKLQKHMLGLRPAGQTATAPIPAQLQTIIKEIQKLVPSFPRKLGIPQTKPETLDRGLPVTKAFRFGSGILLLSQAQSETSEPGTSRLYFVDPEKENYTQINVAALDKIEDLVVMAGHAYITGEKSGTALFGELKTTGFTRLADPPGDGDATLGINSGAVLCLKGKTISQLIDGNWRFIATAPEVLKPVRNVTARIFGGRLYFVDRDKTSLCWIEIDRPQIMHKLSDDFLPKQTKKFHWSEIYGAEVANDNLWVSIGSQYQAPSLLMIDQKGKVSIASLRGLLYMNPTSDETANQNYQFTGLAQGDVDDIYLARGSVLFRLKANVLSILRTQLVPGLQIEYDNWKPNKVIHLGDNSFFLAAKEGGMLHVQVDRQSPGGVSQIKEEKTALNW